MSELHRTLVACHQVISDRQRWCQGFLVLEQPEKESAYCSTGVVEMVLGANAWFHKGPLSRGTRTMRAQVIGALYDALPASSKGSGCADLDWERERVESYNDTHSHGAVMRLWRRAIANEEAKIAAAQRRASETELVVAGD